MGFLKNNIKIKNFNNCEIRNNRRFTHVEDTVKAVILLGKEIDVDITYQVKSYSIIEVANMFNSKIRYLPPRAGERYASALTTRNLTNKVHKLFGKIKLKDYLKNITKPN